MGDKQQAEFTHLKQLQQQVRNDWFDYWLTYSNVDTWQFWVLLAVFLIPLILLYVFIDKKRALLLGFYGYSVHVVFTYIDVLGGSSSYWGYPYKFLPLLPSNFTLDVSLVPVTYIFLYQWVLKKGKNYYLYLTLLSALLAFAFKPLMVQLDLFRMFRGTTYIHLFLFYVLTGLLAKWITNVFVLFEKKQRA